MKEDNNWSNSRSPSSSVLIPNPNPNFSVNDISCLECISSDNSRKCFGWEPNYWDQSKCRICGHLRLLHPSQEPILSTIMLKTLNGADAEDIKSSVNSVIKSIDAVSSNLSLRASGMDTINDNFKNTWPSTTSITKKK